MFPLKGVWMILGNWDDPYNHRTHHSQEFAFDLVQLDKDLRFVQNQEKPNEEYPCYGQDIFAIANGEVVDCLDNVPEIPSATTHLTREQSIQLLQEKGFLSMLLTNGTLITPEVARKIAQLKPVSVGMSLYGATAATHDSITRKYGSFKALIRAFHLLKELDVNVMLHSTLMNSNINDVHTACVHL